MSSHDSQSIAKTTASYTSLTSLLTFRLPRVLAERAKARANKHIDGYNSRISAGGYRWQGGVGAVYNDWLWEFVDDPYVLPAVLPLRHGMAQRIMKTVSASVLDYADLRARLSSIALQQNKTMNDLIVGIMLVKCNPLAKTRKKLASYAMEDAMDVRANLKHAAETTEEAEYNRQLMNVGIEDAE